MDPVRPAPRWYRRRPVRAGFLAVATVWFMVSGTVAACSGESTASYSAAPITAAPATSAAAAPATASASSSPSKSAPVPARSPSKSAPVPARLSPACDPSLWEHVYHPYRLHVISNCKTVSGTVEEVHWEPDGDLHILLRTSPSLVNAGNLAYEHGDLVLEEICKGAVTQADAVAACHGFSWNVTVPSTGDEVTVSGSYVLDADHGWLEIHPVSKLTVTGHAAPAPAPTTQAPPPSSAPPPSPSAPSGCYPKTSGGNCYEPGEFCSAAEHGETGVAGDGKAIECENTDPGSTWHWIAV